jgi:hypothetical protein
MPLSGILFIIAFVCLLIGVPFFTHWADRQRVTRLIVERGGTVLSIKRSFPVTRSLLSERNTTFWRVRYRASDGSVRNAECFASFLRCKIYQEEVASGA